MSNREAWNEQAESYIRENVDRLNDGQWAGWTVKRVKRSKWASVVDVELESGTWRATLRLTDLAQPGVVGAVRRAASERLADLRSFLVRRLGVAD